MAWLWVKRTVLRVHSWKVDRCEGINPELQRICCIHWIKNNQPKTMGVRNISKVYILLNVSVFYSSISIFKWLLTTKKYILWLVGGSNLDKFNLELENMIVQVFDSASNEGKTWNKNQHIPMSFTWDSQRKTRILGCPVGFVRIKGDWISVLFHPTYIPH